MNYCIRLAPLSLALIKLARCPVILALAQTWLRGSGLLWLGRLGQEVPVNFLLGQGFV